MSFAPITIFVYNRPLHIRLTIDALKRNKLAKESELYIYSDGAKNEIDRIKVEEVRNYIKTIDGFKKITVIKRESNFGLANSIIAGVTEIVNKYGEIIVLEDDLLTSPYFLKFINDGLYFYKKEKNVASIQGYVYPLKAKLPGTFFLKDPGCLGWATWKRGWMLFENDGRKLLRELNNKNLTSKFDYNNSYPFTNLLQNQVEDRVDSWAIRWYASLFLKNKLTLYPGESLIFHNGSDGTGTHGGIPDENAVKLSTRPIAIRDTLLEENATVLREYIRYFELIKPPFILITAKKVISVGKFVVRELANVFPFDKLTSKVYTILKKEEFYPTAASLFYHPFYFTRKGLFENIKPLSKYIKGRILDVGCGSKPYEGLFNNASEYIGMDTEHSGHDHINEKIDIYYKGNTFPFKKYEFDSVVTFEVLEHVFNPDEFLEEISRVLKKKGFLLITAPFVWDEHEQPYDYARYSSFGLTYLLKKHHFKIITHKKSVNDIRVFFQLFNNYMYKKLSKFRIYKYRCLSLIANLLFIGPTNIFGSILAKITPRNNDLYLDNIILARKT